MSSVVSRSLIAVGTVAALAAGSAHAGGVHWSVGINAPIAPGVTVGTVISDRPYAPVVVAPAPVYLPAPPVYVPSPMYVPPPVYVPAPVVYPQPVYAPRRVVYAPVWGGPVWVNGRWVQHHHHAHHDRGGYPLPAPVHRPGREIRY
jgi:hypothetical protein